MGENVVHEPSSVGISQILNSRNLLDLSGQEAGRGQSRVSAGLTCCQGLAPPCNLSDRRDGTSGSLGLDMCALGVRSARQGGCGTGRGAPRPKKMLPKCRCFSRSFIPVAIGHPLPHSKATDTSSEVALRERPGQTPSLLASQGGVGRKEPAAKDQGSRGGTSCCSQSWGPATFILWVLENMTPALPVLLNK